MCQPALLNMACLCHFPTAPIKTFHFCCMQPAWHLFPATLYFQAKQKAAFWQPRGNTAALAFEHIAVFLIEFVHTAGAIHDLLFTSVERMALRANFNVEFGFAHGRFSGEFVTARAGNIDFMVVGMNFRFHGFSFKKRV